MKKNQYCQILVFMKFNSLNLKLVIGVAYLSIISIGLYFLFSVIDIKDLMSYEFIKQNKDIILKYKNENISEAKSSQNEVFLIPNIKSE